ncbi:GNAT family protein [Clostridiaceae bacterium HSG29]|nr:GNAT family protein [Clostridiaceae bacterium HSG29]
MVRLMGIDYINRKSYFGIFIGEKEYRNKGIGTEATKLMLDYGFNILNLRNIMLKVFSFNKGAINSYKKCGFKEIGRRRKSIIYGSKEFDEVYMDILSDEFEGSTILDSLPNMK